MPFEDVSLGRMAPQRVRVADGGIKPGVSAANPGKEMTDNVESAERTMAPKSNVSFVEFNLVRN